MDYSNENTSRIPVTATGDKSLHNYNDDGIFTTEDLIKRLSDIDVQSVTWTIPNVAQESNDASCNYKMAVNSYVTKIITDASQEHITDIIHQRYLMRPARFETFIRPNKYSRLPPLAHLPWLPHSQKYQSRNLAKGANSEKAPEKLGWPSPLVSPLALNTFSACILKKLYNTYEMKANS